MRSRNAKLKWTCAAAMCGLQIGLAGCARNLLFSTYTTLGFELQARGTMPTALRLAYKRFEGAIIPVDVGDVTVPEAHSVLASFDANQTWFQGIRITQVFATGAAAELAARTEREAAEKGMRGPISSLVHAMRENVRSESKKIQKNDQGGG